MAVLGALAGFELVYDFIGFYFELELVGVFPTQPVFHLGVSLGLVFEI